MRAMPDMPAHAARSTAHAVSTATMREYEFFITRLQVYHTATNCVRSCQLASKSKFCLRLAVCLGSKRHLHTSEVFYCARLLRAPVLERLY